MMNAPLTSGPWAIRKSKSEDPGSGSPDGVLLCSDAIDGPMGKEDEGGGEDGDGDFQPRSDSPYRVDTEILEPGLSSNRHNAGIPALPQHQFWWPSRVDVDIEAIRKDTRTFVEQSLGHSLNPDLCKFCRVFFDTWSDIVDFEASGKENIETLVSAHYGSTSELEESASNGCRMCTFFVRCWLSTHSEKERVQIVQNLRGLSLDSYKPEGLIYLALQRENFCPALFLYFAEKSPRGGTTKSVNARIRIHTLLISKPPESASEYKGQTSRLLEVAQTTPTRSYEDTTLLHPRRWLAQCRRTHKACRVAEQQVEPPTRLINIDGKLLRLCLSAEQEDCSVYATLSHCWGQLNFLRLLKANMHLFVTGFPSDHGLTKTFADAIKIARGLGFSWLWIDSLCIIQDDPDDWRKESGLMANVYGQSSLNIMASAASDGSTGCLFYRDPILPRGGQLEVGIGGLKRTYDYTDSGLYSKNVDQSPLANRAWVLQERLLSPRRLQFGGSDTVWECRTTCATETYPDGLPPVFYSHAEYLSTHEIWKSWKTILHLYTGTALSFRRDKLIALAGIVRKIHEKTGDRYFAGLWEKNFHRELCWYVRSDTGSRNPPIPSWSWAATDGSIYTPPEQLELVVPCTEIVKVWVHLDDDPFGIVKGGVLTMKSRFLIFCATKTIRNVGRGLYDAEILVQTESVTAELNWDYEEDHSHACVMFPVAIFKDSDDQLLSLQSIQGLLLRNIYKDNGEYERVGRFSIYEDDHPELLQYFNQEKLGEKQESPLGSGRIPVEDDYVSMDVDDTGRKWYTIRIV